LLFVVRAQSLRGTTDTFLLSLSCGFQQVLDLSFATAEECSLWTHCLIRVICELQRESDEEAYLRKYWNVHPYEQYNYKQLKELLKVMNIQVNTKTVKRCMAIIDKDGNGKMDFAEFQCLVQMFKARDEVCALFGQYTSPPPPAGQLPQWSIENCQRFFELEQRVRVA